MKIVAITIVALWFSSLVGSSITGALGVIMESRFTGKARFGTEFKAMRYSANSLATTLGLVCALITDWLLGGFSLNELSWRIIAESAACGAAINIVTYYVSYRRKILKFSNR